MSSTNRGQRGGGEADFFPTPAFPVHRLLERLPLPGGRWLEPGAGDGAIIRAVNAARADVAWTAVELREECRTVLEETGAQVEIGNFHELAGDRWQRAFDVAMLNPPFSDALRFVTRCFALADWVVALERLNWIESQQRHEFFSACMPDIYVVGRIDFNGGGGDSIPYAWFVWPPGDRRRARGTIELLAQTPSVERVPGNLPPPRQLALEVHG